MLKSTFLHLPGIGEHTEQAIWNAGISSWLDLMGAQQVATLSQRRVAGLRSGVVESIQRYERGDWQFFDASLPSRHKWRAFADLADRALYVDIETDGGIEPDSITVIGTYDGCEAQLFVKGRDLAQAGEYISRYPLLVTFNGASFDLPMIRARFPRRRFNHVHVDLLHPLRRLGYSGGLKSVEKQLGLKRRRDTVDLDGWDAVRLWNEYRAGYDESLDLLLKYNEEDIRHLKPLMELVHREMAGSLPRDLR